MVTCTWERLRLHLADYESHILSNSETLPGKIAPELRKLFSSIRDFMLPFKASSGPRRLVMDVILGPDVQEH